MWCPEGYYSWDHVLHHIFDTSSQILSLVCVGGVPPENRDGQRHLIFTAERYLKQGGFADDYAEAELVIGITSAFVLARFLEEYPPVLASVEGSKIVPNRTIFEHKDQLDYCGYDWPLKTAAPFSQFFNYRRAVKFYTDALLDRFVFIDARLGVVRIKNGALQFLMNHGFDRSEADRVVDFVRSVSGYVVCWPSLPTNAQYRELLRWLEVNDDFTKAIDYLLSEAESGVSLSRRPPGRPSMQEEARRVYFEIFPKGHAVEGKTWKEALREVNRRLVQGVAEKTLKRAVDAAGQNPN